MDFCGYIGSLLDKLYLINITVSMKRILALIAIIVLFASCNRYITTHEAANGKARCGRMIR